MEGKQVTEEAKFYRNKSTGQVMVALEVDAPELDTITWERVEVLKPGHVQIDVSEVDIDKLAFVNINLSLEYHKSLPFHNNYVSCLVYNAMLGRGTAVEEPESGFVDVVDDYNVKSRFVRIASSSLDRWLDLDSEKTVSWEAVRSHGRVTVVE